MDIDKTVKAFLLREHIPYAENRENNKKIITCEIEGAPYRIIIDEDSSLLSIVAFVATDEIAIAYQIFPKINTLNQTMFGNFSWHIVDNYIYVFSCRCDQLCIGGITANEQLVEDLMVEVHKGIVVIKRAINKF